MSEEQHPFQPGTEVTLKSSYARGTKFSDSRTRVAKLHKTGRFTLEIGAQQYRPIKDVNGEWYGLSTNFSRNRVELIKP